MKLELLFIFIHYKDETEELVIHCKSKPVNTKKGISLVFLLKIFYELVIISINKKLIMKSKQFLQTKPFIYWNLP